MVVQKRQSPSLQLAPAAKGWRGGNQSVTPSSCSGGKKKLPWTPARRPVGKVAPLDDNCLPDTLPADVGSRSTGFIGYMGGSMVSQASSSPGNMRRPASESQLRRGVAKLEPLRKQAASFDDMYKVAKDRAKIRSAQERRTQSMCQSPQGTSPTASCMERSANYKRDHNAQGASSPEEIAWLASVRADAEATIKLSSAWKEFPAVSDDLPTVDTEIKDITEYTRGSISVSPDEMDSAQKAALVAPFARRVSSINPKLQNVGKYVTSVCKSLCQIGEKGKMRGSILAAAAPAESRASVSSKVSRKDRASMLKARSSVKNKERTLDPLEATHHAPRPDLSEMLAKCGDGMDEYGDQTFQRLQNTFRRYKKDGEIDVQDLPEVVDHLGYVRPTMETVRDVLKEVETRFETLDFVQMTLFVTKYADWEHKHFQNVFEEFDVDGNGELEIDELHKLLLSMGITPLKATLEEALEVVDVDGDGALDFDEFIHLMEVYRVTEGFTRVEVTELARVFSRFADEGAEIQEYQLKDTLTLMFGPQAHKITHQITSDLQELSAKSSSGESNPDEVHGLHLPEFLVWARKTREAELKEYRRQFDVFDKDQSGTIDPGELTDILENLGYVPLRVMVEEILAKVDVDGSGAVNFDEFLTLMGLFRSTDGFTRSELEDFRIVFDLHDLEHDGEVATMELLEIFRHLGYVAKLEEMRVLTDKVDVNGSGTVDFREFVHLMRLHREGELKQVERIFNTQKSTAYEKSAAGVVLKKKSGQVPVICLEECVNNLGYEVKEDTIMEFVVSLGNPYYLDFDAFVQVTDMSRKAFRKERVKRAGFSASDIHHFIEVFESYDKNDSKDIERLELSRMITDLKIPMENHADQHAFIESLDEAREAAREAGIEEDLIGDMGVASITFWPMVHFIRQMVTEEDTVEVDREEAAEKEVKFTPKEVIAFREIFTNWAELSDDTSLKAALGSAPASAWAADGEGEEEHLNKLRTASTMSKLGASQAADDGKWLSGDGIRRIVRSLGLSLSNESRAALEQKVNKFDLDDRGRIDFPDFLRLMRWMLDTNFAQIEGAIKGYDNYKA